MGLVAQTQLNSPEKNSLFHPGQAPALGYYAVVDFLQNTWYRIKPCGFNFLQIDGNGSHTFGIIDACTRILGLVTGHSASHVTYWNNAQVAVLWSEFENIRCSQCISNQVFMREHHSFGGPCGSGCID